MSIELTKQIISEIYEIDVVLSDKVLDEYLRKDRLFIDIYWKKWLKKHEVQDSLLQRCLVFNKCYSIVMQDIKNDIKLVCDNIKFCKNKLNIDYSNKKIQYFLDVNTEALMEIYDFKSNYLKDRIIDKVYHFCKGEQNTYSPYSRAYSFSYQRHLYCPEGDRGIIAIFDPISKDEYEKYCEKKQDSDEYLKTLNMLISTLKVTELIATKIQTNFTIKKRENIFDSIIKFYKSNKWELVVNLLVMQIEGIFHDYKSFVKVNENIVPANSISVKAKEAYDTNKYLKLKFYPYFAFDFADLRNEVAHYGLIVTPNLEIMAKELILATYNLLSMFDGFYLPFNNAKLIFNTMLRESQDLPFIDIFTKSCVIFADLPQANEKYNVYAIIKDCETHKDKMELSILNNGENAYNMAKYCLKEISTVSFWQEYIDVISQSKDSVSIHFEMIANEFISVFPRNSDIKNKIIELKKLLEETSNDK